MGAIGTSPVDRTRADFCVRYPGRKRTIRPDRSATWHSDHATRRGNRTTIRHSRKRTNRNPRRDATWRSTGHSIRCPSRSSRANCAGAVRTSRISTRRNAHAVSTCYRKRLNGSSHQRSNSWCARHANCATNSCIDTNTGAARAAHGEPVSCGSDTRFISNAKCANHSATTCTAINLNRFSRTTTRCTHTTADRAAFDCDHDSYWNCDITLTGRRTNC